MALATRARANPLGRNTQPRIAIVGAGISGLNCALALADKGLNATIYEASGRVGGRMYSNNTGYWNDNQVTEWCGEEIDPEHTEILSLAARFGLITEHRLPASTTGQSDTYYLNGKYYSLADAVSDLGNAYPKIQDAFDAAGNITTYNQSTREGRRLDHTSVKSWIQHNIPGGVDSKLGQLLVLNSIDEYGADCSDQSALNLIYVLGGEDGDDTASNGTTSDEYHIRGGNEQIPQAIAAYLATQGTPVRTDMSMASIRMLPDGTYRMTFNSSVGISDVDADLVVLTLPFAVLRTLDYRHAGFDPLKTYAIQNQGAGRNGKLQLQFTHRLWNDAGPWGISDGQSYSSSGYMSTIDPTRAQFGDSGILDNYTGGRFTSRQQTQVPFATVENVGVQADVKYFLNQVAPVYPGLPDLWNGKATQSLPHLSPYFKCSYSYLRVGQYHKFSGYERVRQKNIFFAGEHTSVQFGGYMEGGAQEGARAAQEILTQFGLS